MEVKIKFQNSSVPVIEREASVVLKPDSDMADLIRFLKASVPNVI